MSTVEYLGQQKNWQFIDDETTGFGPEDMPLTIRDQEFARKFARLINSTILTFEYPADLGATLAMLQFALNRMGIDSEIINTSPRSPGEFGWRIILNTTKGFVSVNTVMSALTGILATCAIAARHVEENPELYGEVS